MISREMLHTAFDDALRNVRSERLSRAVIHSVVENVPAVEPLRGEWLQAKQLDTRYRLMRCSACGRGYGECFREEFNFCPRCGADMRGDNNDKTASSN